MLERKKFDEITIMNCFLCLMVMFIHSSSLAVNAADKESYSYMILLICTRLSAFVVQGFVFLSAFKMFCSSNKTEYIPFIINKFKNIYIPYLMWNFIYYINFIRHGYFSFSVIDYIRYCLNGTLSSPFYFVVMIMQFYLLEPFWRVIYCELSPIIGIGIALFITLFGGDFISYIYMNLFNAEFIYLDRFFTTYLLYWTIGAYTGIYYQKVISKLQKYIMPIILIFIFLATFNVYYYYQFTTKGIIFPYLNEVLQIYCVSAIFLTLLISQKIKYVKLFDVLSKMTFSIYLNHCFILFYVDEFAHRISFSSLTRAYLYRLSFLFISTIFLNYIYIVIKKPLYLSLKKSLKLLKSVDKKNNI